MKTVKEQVYLTAESIEYENNCDKIGYRYTFTSPEPIDIYSMEHFVEVGVPENMGEFRKLNRVSSKELLDWLNKNYK